MVEALDIRVRGVVQGVGFRPFVYRMAKHYLVNGWVLNDKDGVFIHAEAETNLLDEFVMAIADEAPSAAQVAEVELTEVPLQDCVNFEIRESIDTEAKDVTKVSPDLGICDDCLAELYEIGNRRFRYPFINCTNCGPRFTIINSLPYDRPSTSMAPFVMCPECAAEYDDPLDRRFHAQPDACFICGPSLTWWTSDEKEVIAALPQKDVEEARQASDFILSAAVKKLAEGEIIAVKGLGGFHLVCDATNRDAVNRLRKRKGRDEKPFAVMVADIDAARKVCEVSDAEAALLSSPARPIVLLKKRADVLPISGIADGVLELGIMLPATPLQSLLIHDFQEATNSSMLVMTSGNLHKQPIVISDEEAIEKLGSIADGIIGNDRKILSRFDDSVVRVLNLDGNEAVQFIRRARGYAPLPIPVGYGQREIGEGQDELGLNLDSSLHPVVFAAGSEQKNTFTYIRGDEAYVSQYIGDMEDADIFDAWHDAKERIEHLFDLRPRVLACDLHPEYIASKWAHSQAFKEDMPLTEVQHHHAHIASVLGEHNLFGPCCGIAFDGTGYGLDGAIWGGEVLITNQIDYERFANFSYVPMPGGQAAIKHPKRMAYGLLWAYDLLDHPAACSMLDSMGEEAALCGQMIEEEINTPYTSSVGRLFDGVAALLGVCTEPTYEGEAAVLLDGCKAPAENCSEQVASEIQARYAITVQKNAATTQSTAHDTSVVVFDLEQTLRAILDDMENGVPVPIISLRFHQAIVGSIVQAAELVRGVYDISLVVLSGGCFMNRYLMEQSASELGKRGFTVAVNGNLPPNDGCVSYGQALIASVSR